MSDRLPASFMSHLNFQRTSVPGRRRGDDHPKFRYELILPRTYDPNTGALMYRKVKVQHGQM